MLVICSWLLATLLISAEGSSAQPGTADPVYVVLSAVPDGDPYEKAADVLVATHEGTLLRFDPADLASLAEELRGIEPTHAAIVLRPEQLDFDLARRFLQLATEIDDDPFVDLSFGYITGRTPKGAVRLATLGAKRRPLSKPPKLATFAGGVKASRQQSSPVQLQTQELSSTAFYCAGEDAFPEEGRDVPFVEKTLRKLRGKVDALTFVGHGYPHEVVGGPRAEDVRKAKLKNAVVFNVGCYTGVTSRWYESDYRAGREQQKQVASEDSFALAILDAGVVGYTAYLCPRPAGPELDCDRAALIADGASLGDARRRDYDKTVLGFLGFGEPRMVLGRVEDGTPLVRGDAVRHMMLEGATGGIVFGDPACVPFAKQEGESPVHTETAADGEDLLVRATVGKRALFLHCSDPTAKMGGRMAMKVHARVPIGDLEVQEVSVERLTVGDHQPPTRVLWAIETDRGSRFLQLKVNFPRSTGMYGDLEMEARIVAAPPGQAGSLQGGETVSPGASTTSTPVRDLQECADARSVGAEALAAAVAASTALGPAPPESAKSRASALEDLVELEREGFRAVCALIDAGETHYRTVELLKAAWAPGDERLLLELADGPELPNYASWAVLEGLGVADTDEVRAYLLQRLEDEDNAGLFMATAKGLARLKEPAAVSLVGDRLLERRTGWTGIAAHLVMSLRTIGGKEALDYLKRYEG